MKRNLLLSLTIFAALTCLSSCSSPESDGKKAGKEMVKCYKDNIVDRIDAVSDFIEDFNASDYSSRSEARKKLSEIDSSASVKLEEEVEEIQKNIHDKRKKYITNAEKIQQFDYAQSAIKEEAESDIEILLEQYSNLIEEANQLILTIAAAKPTEEGMPMDLVGKTIVEPTHELYRSQFVIESSEMVKSLSVENVEESGDLIIYTVKMMLNDGINDYQAKAKITYELADRDDWTIQYIESEYLDIVPTGKFNNCIKVTKNEGWMGTSYIFSNNCDVALVVEGKGIKYREWENFSILVSGQSQSTLPYYTDIVVNRIERP